MLTPSARVLVLDGSARQALAACRALGRAGWDVETAGYTASAVAGMSRWSLRYHRLAEPSESSDFAEALTTLVVDRDIAVVVATDDVTIERLRRGGTALLTVPTSVGAALLSDKLRLAEIAAGVGLAYPRTEAVGSASDLPGVVDRLGSPLVIKASSSAVQAGARIAGLPGALVTPSMEEASLAINGIEAAAAVALAQQHVRRQVKIDVALFRVGGHSTVRMAYEVIRDTPLTGGLGVTLRTISVDEGPGRDAVEGLERIVDATGYEGVANGEFSISADDGLMYLIEVNPRLWASAWFAERLGQRVAERCVLHALGHAQPPAVAAPPGRRFHHLVGEARWVGLHERRLAALLAVLRDTRPWDVFEYDDLRDLRPLRSLAGDLWARRSACP